LLLHGGGSVAPEQQLLLIPPMRRGTAEMFRVLRPNGIIVWYDLFLNTQGSSYLRPVTKEERLAPLCTHYLGANRRSRMWS
jgi:hypothetical protein